jgi:hypothetical protein
MKTIAENKKDTVKSGQGNKEAGTSGREQGRENEAFRMMGWV